LDMTKVEIFHENPFSFALEMVTIGRKDHVRGTTWPPAAWGSNCSELLKRSRYHPMLARFPLGG
jgi:hypothetical protein